jgi:prepilin-type N-terminal cleavage/methylation domain-containing protein
MPEIQHKIAIRHYFQEYKILRDRKIMRISTVCKSAGFTLIELMITVALVGILAAIAVPSYQNYVRQSNRAVAKSLLYENAQFMERFYSQNNQYDATVGAEWGCKYRGR